MSGRVAVKPEPSRLARLVVAYHEKFGRHVPEPALRAVGAGVLASMIENALAISVSLVETDWDPPCAYSPRGCCIFIADSEGATPTKGPNGEWLH